MFSNENVNTALRGLIALVVIGITCWLTVFSVSISSEWEAVFLVVIAYYFKERPMEELYINSNKLEKNILRILDIEILAQFLIAIVLILGSVVTFVYPQYKSSISGTWIGAVVLAIAFYFKISKYERPNNYHHIFRVALAAIVTLCTIPIVIIAGMSGHLEVPLQWVGIVLIVVAFYFKETH